MMTFDKILPSIKKVLISFGEELKKLGPIVINRDLNGRVRLILEDKLQDQSNSIDSVKKLAHKVSECLGLHGFSAENIVFYEASLDSVKRGAPCFQLDGFDDVTVVERLASETDWSRIEPIVSGAPRIVFYSVKGGVGRSTAAAAAAWSLAQSGKRVMLLDLDLESPGVSSSLLPDERRPIYGITDWLVEDLVDNGAALLKNMIATSDLSHDGEIYVVPAHGRDPGEYISKLGRVWMPKMNGQDSREAWSMRLRRLLSQLEEEKKPDVVLIDSRAGIDEVASACVTDLGAKGVFLFAIAGEQTWSGYSVLFHHWNLTGVAREIRERLQLVGAMIPEVDRTGYFEALRERSWSAFTELYDEVPAGGVADTCFSFDQTDENAPHYPCCIHWNRGFSALQSIHSRLQNINEDELKPIFGEFVQSVHTITDTDNESKP